MILASAALVEVSTAIDHELRRARASLRDEAADLALQLAAEALRARVTDEDRARLVDEFIDTIEAGGQSPGATRAEGS